MKEERGKLKLDAELEALWRNGESESAARKLFGALKESNVAEPSELLKAKLLAIPTIIAARDKEASKSAIHAWRTIPVSFALIAIVFLGVGISWRMYSFHSKTRSEHVELLVKSLVEQDPRFDNVFDSDVLVLGELQ